MKAERALKLLDKKVRIKKRHQKAYRSVVPESGMIGVVTEQYVVIDAAYVAVQFPHDHRLIIVHEEHVEEV